jgi:hypothetical protein
VAREWDAVARDMGDASASLAELLEDTEVVRDPETLARLVELVAEVPDAHAPSRPVSCVDWGLPPYREGYRAAQEVRAARRLGDEPLTDARFRELLRGLGVEAAGVDAGGLFRSAVWSRGNGALLAWAKDDPRFSGPVPRRFSIAAALGRYLAVAERGRPMGAAHGPQARWRPTQFANAFAAELLLPTQAILRSGASAAELARKFRISRTAAEWHVANRAEMREA